MGVHLCPTTSFLSLFKPLPNPTTFSKLRDQTQKQEKEKWLAVQVELFLLWCLLYCQFANSKATCSLAGRRKGLRKRSRCGASPMQEIYSNTTSAALQIEITILGVVVTHEERELGVYNEHTDIPVSVSVMNFAFNHF